MWRIVEHADSFMQRADYDVVFLGVNVLDRLFQVAYAAVDDFSCGAGSGSGKVAGVKQHSSKPSKLGVKSTSSSRRSATDHADIKRFARDIAQLYRARFHKVPQYKSKVDLRAEPQDSCIRNSGIGAHIDVVLKHRLEENVRSHVKSIVQFDGLFRAQQRQANARFRKAEGIADLAVHHCESDGVLEPAWNQPIIAKTSSDLAVLPVDIIRAPVKADRHIKASVRSGLRAVQRLVDLPVDEVVPAAPDSRGVRKFSAIIRGTEFEGARVGFLQVPTRSWTLVSVGVPSFEQEIGAVLYHETQPCRILLVRAAVAGDGGCRDIKVVGGLHANLYPWGSSRIERFECIREEVPERVVQGLDDVGRAVDLVSVKIESGKLAGFHEKMIVEKRLLQPPGIEASRVRADKAAGIRDHSNVGAEIGAKLPQTGRVKRQPISVIQSPKVNIHRSADSSPSRLGLFQAADGIGLQIRDIEEAKCNSPCRQLASLSSPVTEQVLPGL